MIMKKKLASIICIVMCSLTLTCCFNYKEINRMTFATSIIFDRDENNNVVIYIDCVKPYRNAGDSSDEGKRMIFKGEGKTSLEAIRDISEISSNKLNFSQVKSYIFTEQVAQDGIERYINLINNDQQFGFKPYMFVYFGEVSELLDIIGNDDEYLGLYLNDLVQNNIGNGKIISENVNDYISNSFNKDAINIITAVEIKDDMIDKKIQLNGGAVIRDNKMIKKMEPSEVLSYNLLMEPVTEGTFEIQNPNEPDKFVTLDILEKSQSTQVNIKNDNVIINKNLDIRVAVGEIQGKLVVSNEVLNTMKNTQEEKIKNYLENLFNDYKKEGIDLIGVNRLIEEKYPHKYIENTLQSTALNVNINIIIEGSSLIKNSL